MKCPGQDTQYWNAEAIYDVDCPSCGKSVEFYKDDTNRKCPGCRHRFVNPKMDFGCAAYCQFAEQCLGTLPEEFVGSQDNLLKDKVAVEVKRFHKSDFHKIGHATRVAKYAEKIGMSEGGNLPVILCAAYLKDLNNGNDLQTDNPARIILEKLKAKEQIADAVCSLIDLIDLSDKNEATELQTELNILNEANMLASFEEALKQANSSNSELPVLPSTLITTTGQQLATDLSSRYSS